MTYRHEAAPVRPNPNFIATVRRRSAKAATAAGSPAAVFAAVFVAAVLGACDARAARPDRDDGLAAAPSATPVRPSPLRVAGPPDGASIALIVLSRAGIDASIPRAEIAQWLREPDTTPYPALSQSLLLTFDSKMLRRPVYLDVVAWNYEHTPGVRSPRSVSDVDGALLRAAVLAAYNQRYGETVGDFDSLLVPSR